MNTVRELEQRLKAVERSEEQLKKDIEILLEISAVIRKSHNLESAVIHILEVAKKVIPYDTASLQILEGDYLQVVGGSGFLHKEELRKLRFKYPMEGSLSTCALNTGKPVLANDVKKDFPYFTQPPGELEIHSWMGIPMILYDEKIGLISLDSSMKNGFSQYHLKLAELIANPLAIVLENARIHENIYLKAMEDFLTRLGSRYRFEIEGRIMLDSARRNRKRLAIALLDIDKFKAVNDMYGHLVGDEVLKSLADSISPVIRPNDLAARLGGDEFVFVFWDLDEGSVKAILDRITAAWSMVSHPGIKNPVTLSFGFHIMIPEEDTSLDSMVNKADAALYNSKNMGRNRISVYRES